MSRRVGEICVTASSTESRSDSLSAGDPSICARSPSSRRIGGWPSLRWMSLAPLSTAVLNSAVRSITAEIIGNRSRRL